MVINGGWKNDLIILFFVLLFITLSVFIPKILKEKDLISKYGARKIIHSLAGLSIFSTPYFNYPFIALIIAFIMTIITKKSSNESNNRSLKSLFEAISEREELKYGYLQGPFAYSLAITLLTFIFLFMIDKFYYAIAAILIMMYADTLASIIGQKYGKHPINVPFIGNKRTLEGSLTFFVCAFICSYFSFTIIVNTLNKSFYMIPLDIFKISFLMSLISTILELLSPSKYDDLIVPIGTVLIIIPIVISMGLW